MIDSVLYSEIYRSEAFLSEDIDTANAIYMGGMREDGNKHIYFKPDTTDQIYSNNCYTENQTSDEFVLYNFDLEIGDTFYINPFSYYEVVLDIDSILVDSSYRKRFLMYDQLGGDIWIEGIGSEKSLFGSICYVFEGFEMLLCYEDPSTFYMGEWNDLERCTDFIVGYSDQPDLSFRIFPNPVFSNESIRIMGQANGNLTIELFDLAGKQLQRIDVSNLPYDMRVLAPPGVYLISLKVNNRKYYKKLVVK